MRKIFSILAVLLFCWQSAAWAAERVPVRVVQMPLAAGQTFQTPSFQTVHAIESKVRNALHVPLNGVLGSVEYVPVREAGQAEEKLKAEKQDSYLTASYEQQIMQLAKTLDADFLVMPRLTAYEQYTYMSWNWNRGMMLHSYAALELYIYDREAGKVEKSGTSRFYHDEYSASGTADVLAQECIDSLLVRTKLHEKLWARVKAREQEKDGANEILQKRLTGSRVADIM